MRSRSQSRKQAAKPQPIPPAETQQTQAATPAGTQPDATGGGEAREYRQADLNSLPPSAQAELVDHLLGHSIPETIEWLAAKGIDTTGTALSLFHNSYSIRQTLIRSAAIAQMLAEEVGRQVPALAPEQLRELGQVLFTRLAIDKKDVASWKITQELELKRSKLELDWQKFRTQSHKAGLDADGHGKSDGLTHETSEKIERAINLF